MSKYRARYIYSVPYGSPVHTWEVVMAMGGSHLHIHDHGADHLEKYGQRYSGGIEIHYRQPPMYMIDSPPSHDQCQLIKAPCWHDGSSVQATEFWIPLWLEDQHDHDRIFRKIADDAANKMVEE